MWYTVKQIATALGITSRAVQKRSKKEDWPWKKSAGLGHRRSLALADLPWDVQQAVMGATQRPPVREEGPGFLFTTKQVAEALGVTTQAVSWRSKKEDWSHVKRPGRGGGKLFGLATLPEDVRTALVNSGRSRAPKGLYKRVQRLNSAVAMLQRELELLNSMMEG